MAHSPEELQPLPASALDASQLRLGARVDSLCPIQRPVAVHALWRHRIAAWPWRAARHIRRGQGSPRPHHCGDYPCHHRVLGWRGVREQMPETWKVFVKGIALEHAMAPLTR